MTRPVGIVDASGKVVGQLERSELADKIRQRADVSADARPVRSLRDPARRAKFDPELFARYRAATGAAKRTLLDQLVWENEPLMKILVDQLCGRGPARKNGIKLGGLDGFRDVDWDDAMQCARVAFLKAMDQWRPDGGSRLPYYLLLKIRYEIQCLVQREGLARVPRGREDEAFAVDLVGEQQALDELSRGHHEDGLVTSEDFTTEDVERWAETGEWPEDAQTAKVDVARHREIQRLESWNPIEAFLSTQLVFWAEHRTPRQRVFARFDRFLIAHNAVVGRGVLVASLAQRGVRQVSVWAEGTAVRGFAGVDLRAV